MAARMAATRRAPPRCVTVCASKYVIVGALFFIFFVVMYMREASLNRHLALDAAVSGGGLGGLGGLGGSTMLVSPHCANVESDLSGRGRLLSMPTRAPPMSPSPRSPPRVTAPVDDPTHARGLPINIRTSGSYSSEYTQVGFLSNGKENLVPLYGRMIMPNRNKWQYYTMSDRFHSIRLPITVGGKNASSEYGCDEVNNGDTVYVEGYNAPFKVTLYERDHFQYIPYL